MSTIIDLLIERLETQAQIDEIGENHIRGFSENHGTKIDYAISICEDNCEIFMTSPQLVHDHYQRLKEFVDDGLVVSENDLSVSKKISLVSPDTDSAKLIMAYFCYMLLGVKHTILDNL